MNVTFLFTTKPGNLLSFIIRTVEGRKFSHVIVQARSVGLQRDVLFEATIPDVTMGNPTLMLATETIIERVDIPVSDAENLAILQFMVDNSGKTYATAKLFGIMWKRLMKRLGRNIKNPADNGDKTEECAEAGALILKILGVMTTDDLESVGPGWVRDQAVLLAQQRTAPK